MAESKGRHFITQLNKYDVLCGRGSGPNERVGNINFRDLVYTRKTEYLAINPRDHKNKNRIAREIVEIVRSRGGRFLKKAAVDIAEDGTEAYELADETAVLEKAKQALRQNRTGRTESYITADVYARSQSNMVEGVSHLPPQPNPYHAFVSHLQQANYAMSPAESAIRNLQMQNYMAQQQHQCNPHQENYTPRQNPYFSTSGKGVDHGQYIHAIAMQQYKPTQEHSIPNNIIPGQPNLSTTTATDPDHIMFHLGQKMKQNMHNVSGLSGNTASIPRGREPCDKSITSVKTTGNSFSDSQMKALEDIFVSASQSIPKVRIDSRSQQHGTSTREHIKRSSIDSRSQQHGTSTREHTKRSSIDSRSQQHGTSTRESSESFIDGLEDMSLPSMSIGEISDFSAQGASLSRSKRSVGGTIVETAEIDDSANGSSQEQNSSSVAGYRECFAERHVSFVGSENSSLDEVAAAAVLQAMNDENPNQQMPQRSNAAKRDTNCQPLRTDLPGANSSASQKKQRRSLSSYYREMKASHSGCPPTKESADAMSLE